ncbi:MAG: hypothetical protein JNM07_13350 [Phycisphaerae bacterium]|nr:hypothetical protein [Phycisphaerae bacterium]
MRASLTSSDVSLLAGIAACCLSTFMPTTVEAKDGNPVYTFSDQNRVAIARGQLGVDFWWVKDGGNATTKKDAVGGLIPAAKAETMAAAVLTRLTGDAEISADWDFSLMGVPNNNPKTFIVQGTPKAGRAPKMKFASAAVPQPWVNLKYSGAIDPILGTALWDVNGLVTNDDIGDIGIGIEGHEVVTTTYDPISGIAKSIDQIKLDLLDGLHSEGYTSAFIDPYNGMITLPDITTGDPVGTDGLDLGASFFSTDMDLGGSGCIAVPSPATGMLLAPFACAAARRRKR